MTVYPAAAEETPVRYALGKNIEAVKDAVSIEDVAAEYGEFRRTGAGRLLGRCIAPDHQDKTPSMTVYTESQRFKCYGCGISGDVIDLEEISGRHVETWTAVIALSERFGVELWQRPEGWHRKQTRQRSVREAIDAQRVEHIRLLVFRLICMPWLKQLPEWMRQEATESAWRDSSPLAQMLYEQRRGL